jgi:hypothetical protein
VLFDPVQFVPSKNHTLGELVLINRGIFTESYWYWISVGALFGFAILFNIGFTIALDWMRRKFMSQTLPIILFSIMFQK